MDVGHRHLNAVYPDTTAFSGQRLASELMLAGLEKRGWHVERVLSPAYRRQDGNGLAALGGLVERVATFVRRVCGMKRRLLYVNLGQSAASVVREGFALFWNRAVTRQRCIVSLHGSTFLRWRSGSLLSRIFAALLRTADCITVLGPSMSAGVARLGVEPDRVATVDNSCSLSPLSNAELLRKHRAIQDGTNRLTVLYLSSLIDAKGYVRFAEAIERLALDGDMSLDATICGTVFDAAAERDNMDRLRQLLRELPTIGSDVSLRWIEGATGDAKADLFRRAHMFVLPTVYQTEAQPITILEALASGAAVITTTVGEIGWTVDAATASFLDHGSAEEIAATIRRLAHDHDRRYAMAQDGLELYERRFSLHAHVDRWETVLDRLAARIGDVSR